MGESLDLFGLFGVGPNTFIEFLYPVRATRTLPLAFSEFLDLTEHADAGQLRSGVLPDWQGCGDRIDMRTIVFGSGA